MPKVNRKCFHCGKDYYCCKSCISINSWKNTCCSRECFMETLKKTNINIQPTIINKGGTTMKGVFKSNNKSITISGYDLDLGKFDCVDGSTKVTDDFAYFIVTSDEIKEFTTKNTNKTDISTTEEVVALKKPTSATREKDSKNSKSEIDEDI